MNMRTNDIYGVYELTNISVDGEENNSQGFTHFERTAALNLFLISNLNLVKTKLLLLQCTLSSPFFIQRKEVKS